MAVIVYCYVAYAAISISSVLSNRVYRNQSLGLGVVTILMVIFVAGTTLGPSSNTDLTGVPYLLAFGCYYAIFIGLYYWIDASIRTARFSDPLYRDTFHWSRMRLVFWAYIIGAYVLFSVTGAIGVYSYATASSLGQDLIGLPLIFVIFAGAVVLPAAVRRSKDKVLRRNLDWFAIWTIVVLGIGWVGIGFTPLSDNVQTLITLIVVAPGGYLLYRSATSLFPVYKFNKEPSSSI